MSLQDFLGRTSNITIIDFLAENFGEEYNQTEISECTGLSRTTIHEKLPELILNKIIEISDETARIKRFRLKENDIINYLIKAALAHSFAIAEEVKSEQEQYDQIYESIKPEVEEPINVYLSNKILGVYFPEKLTLDFGVSTNSPIGYLWGRNEATKTKMPPIVNQ